MVKKPSMAVASSSSSSNGGGSGGKASQRLQLACEPCRAAKLKCDRTLPICEQCYKRSRESACKYSEKGLRYISVAQKATSMKEKIERLELLVSKLKDPEVPDANALSTTVPESSPTRGQEEAESPSRTGKIKLSRTGSTQWVGPSHWESIIDDIADVKAYFELQEAVESSEDDGRVSVPNDNVPNMDITMGTLHGLRKYDILERMPSRAEMDRFVATWFNAMDPARIVVHAPTFQLQYQRFWRNPMEVDPAFLSFILAMISLGAEISGQTVSDTSILARAEYLGRLTAHAIVLADSSRPQPHLIEALLLYIISLLYRHHDTTTHIWHLVGLTMRLCYQAGYHRDPKHNPRITPFHAEMRRRVWMVACELDISVSNTLGVVSCLKRHLCDTDWPANFLDTDFSPTHRCPPRGPDEYTLVLSEMAFTKVIVVLGDIVASTHAVKPASMDVVRHLHARLAHARDQLPEKLRMVPLEQCFIDSPFEIADRLRIDFAYQRALCMLYRRFIGVPGREAEHRRCLVAADTIVTHCIAMLEAAQPGGQLAPLKVLLVRHIRDHILGAMLLCLEIKRLAGEGGDRSRAGEFSGEETRAKLLRACELWSTPGIPSTKAQVALNTMVRFLTGEQQQQQQQQQHPQPQAGNSGVVGHDAHAMLAATPTTTNPVTGFPAEMVYPSSTRGNSVMLTPSDGAETGFGATEAQGGFGEMVDFTTGAGELNLPWSWPPCQDGLEIRADPSSFAGFEGLGGMEMGEWMDPSPRGL